MSRALLRGWLCGGLLASQLVACATGPRVVAKAAPPAVRVEMNPLVFAQKADGKVETGGVSLLFVHAQAAFEQKRFEVAFADYRSIVEQFPDSTYVVPALYNAGLSLEALGRRREAVEQYQQMVERVGLKPACQDRAACDEILDALFREAQVLGELEDYAAQAEIYDRVLTLRGVRLQDQMEAKSRKGVALFHEKKYADAEHVFYEQLEYYRSHASEERLDTDFFIGMASYYLAELSHIYYRALPVRAPSTTKTADYEKQLMADLEAKARLVLATQARYLDTIRIKNPEWATAAGYQIGSLYREFYDDLVSAPLPPELDEEAKEVYLEEVKKKVRNLLFKAVRTHERNLVMAERTGVKNEWVERSNEQLEQLKQLLLPGSPLNPLPDAPPPQQPPTLPTVPSRS